MPPLSRLYMDNAATSFPKPPAVAQAVFEHLAHSGGSAGRGAYREAIESGRLFDRCRAALRSLFGLRANDGVAFALNCTDALNLAIKGLVPTGGHVVTSAMDHNSVLRPLSALAERSGVRWDAIIPNAETTRLDPRAIADAICPDTALVVLSHASNVTGALQPIREIAAACRAQRVPLLLDAAQTAGHVPIDFDELGIDLLACPGHKGLMGPLGTGVLAFRQEFAARIRTLREGGTGSSSELPNQPESLPDKFEPGSQNAVGVAGFLAALEWILERGVAAIRAHEMELSAAFVERVSGIDGFRLYGPIEADRRVGVFSFSVDGLEPSEVAALLESRFEILTRAGLHCAPLAHRAMGTVANGGLTRASFGAFTTVAEVDRLADALAALSGVAPTSARRLR